MPSAIHRRRSALSTYLIAAVIGSSALAQPVGAMSETLTPAAGVIQTVYVGGDLLRSEVVRTIPGARVSKTVEIRGVLGAFGVSAYEPLSQVASSSAFKVCSGGDNACLLDDDGDGTFDRIATSSVGLARRLRDKVPYERVRVADPASRVTRYVTLASIQGSVIYLRYHERSADQSAYEADETITIPISTRPRTVKIRDFQITIVAVNLRGLTYVIAPRPNG